MYVDPTGPAVDQLRAYEAAGQTADATLIRKIADRPVAAWFADETTDPAVRARALVTAASAAGQMPVLTLYRIPQRDCGSHSGGGATTAAEYEAWVASIAAAIAGHRAIVIVEPDSVAQAVQGCLNNTERTQRYAMLGKAIDTLAANPLLRVYLDGGNPSWITDTARMGEALKKAGVQRADGFALNVANFETTASNLKYGTKLSAHLNNAHFVVDTSRNGNGPARKTNHDGHWCNPAGRALGDVPTLHTGHKLADAYLWIKRPGESDGPCGAGAPAAGQWYPQYALDLARN
ncbi:glycoside hydrolase family 6 protein [Actinoplanes bogorensis]|uniref:Glucanase n=1 Tax=Paractinoplanes bogorensis TaxID=1610840 RepID=A0ABS5Z3M9_9ACTN|nr:glycoside hydrolase family 6 protein [Actinoplanes bogorensis]